MRSSRASTRAAVASTPGASRALSASRAARTAADAASVRAVSACSADASRGESLEAARSDGNHPGRPPPSPARPRVGAPSPPGLRRRSRSSRGGPRPRRACRRRPVALRPLAGAAPLPDLGGRVRRQLVANRLHFPAPAGERGRGGDKAIRQLGHLASRKKASSVSSRAGAPQQRGELPLREQNLKQNACWRAEVRATASSTSFPGKVRRRSSAPVEHCLRGG